MLADFLLQVVIDLSGLNGPKIFVQQSPPELGMRYFSRLSSGRGVFFLLNRMSGTARELTLSSEKTPDLRE